MEIAFRLADDVLRQSVQGITELITEPGLINVDFAHIRRLIQLGGGALMAIGQGTGENKARAAVEQALHHPLLEAVSLDSAAGIIANFTGGSDLSLMEVQEAVTLLQEQTGPQTETVLGVINDERMDGRAQVILVITGLGASTLEDAMRGVQKVRPAQEAGNVRHIQPIPALETEPIAAKASPAPIRQAPDVYVNSQNVDIPAFLRRRVRYAGS